MDGYEPEGMSPSPDSATDSQYHTLRGERLRDGGWAPGWLGSLLLHGLFLLLFLVLVRSTSQTPQSLVRLVPVNIVQLAEETTSPRQQLKATVPQQRAAVRRPLHRSVPVATAPAKTLSPPDAIDAQLRALARLREPDTNLPVLDNSGASNVDATSDDAGLGAQATYSVRDYIRNQVERRWSLNFARLGGHSYDVLIHIELKRNGTIAKAEIVDRTRFATDAAYHDVALSARNAVLLSSPIALPAGQLQMPMDLTLNLNSKDALR
jgi:hypothetical protein